MNKMNKEHPLLPQEAIKIEKGSRYIMKFDLGMPTEEFSFIQKELDRLYGEKVIVAISGDFDLYKLDI